MRCGRRHGILRDLFLSFWIGLQGRSSIWSLVLPPPIFPDSVMSVAISYAGHSKGQSGSRLDTTPGRHVGEEIKVRLFKWMERGAAERNKKDFRGLLYIGMFKLVLFGSCFTHWSRAASQSIIELFKCVWMNSDLSICMITVLSHMIRWISHSS